MAEKKSWRDYSKNYSDGNANAKTTDKQKTGTWRDYSKLESGSSGGQANDWRNYSNLNTTSIVGENIINRVNSWLQNHSSYISDYQNRYSGRKYSYEDAYVSDSSDWLAKATERKSSLDAEAEDILSYIDQYKGYLNQDWIDDVKYAITSARGTQNQLIISSKRDNEYWMKFTPNEEQTAAGYTADKLYTEWQAEQKQYAEDLAYDVEAGQLELEGLKKDREAWLADQEEKRKQAQSEESFWDKLARWMGNTPTDTTIPVASTNDATSGRSKYDKQISELEDRIERAKYVQGYEGYMGNINASDYAANSQYVSTRTDVAKEDALWGLYKNQYDETKLFGDFLYDYINRNQDALDVAMVNNTASNASFFGFDQSFLQTMTDNEIGVYNYLYKTQGQESANTFLSHIQSDLEGRKRVQEQAFWAEYAKSDPVGSSVFSTLISPLKGLSYLGQAADMLDDGKMDQNAGYNRFSYIPSTIRSQVSTTIEKSGKWGKVGSFAYNTGMSMADFLFTTAVSGGNQALSLAIMGTGAAADATISAKDRGLDDGQAFALGTIAGLAEVAMEKISLGAWLEGDMTEGALRYVLKNALSEGGEEAGTSLINLLADVMISGDKSEWNMAMQAYIDEGKSPQEAFGLVAAEQAAQIGLDALGGMLSGAAIGGGTYAGTSIASKFKYGDIAKNKASAQKLVTEGLEFNPDSQYIQKAQSKLDKGKNLTGMQVRNILAANQEKITANDMKKIQQAAEKRLSDLGQTQDVAKVAEIATKWATGQEITSAEKKLLTHSKYGSRVANELLPSNIESGEYATAWAEEIGTRKVNAKQYNKKAIENVRAIVEQMKSMEDPNAYKSLESRMEADKPVEVSSTGKAVIRATGEEIDLTAPTFKQISEDGVMLEANGKMVSSNEIDYDSEDQGLAINAIGKIEHMTPTAASALYAKLDMTKPVMGQLNGMDEAFTYGFYNYSEADLKAGNFTENLTEDQLNDAYKLGQYVRGKSDVDSDAPVVKMRTEAEAKLSEEQKTAKQKARIESNDVEVYFQDGKSVVKFDEHTGKYDDKRMAAVNTAKFLSKLGIGGKYYFFESYVNADGVRVYKDADGNEVEAPNGMYKDADGSIHIDLNAGDYGQGTALFTMGHELGHFVKAQSKKQFKILCDIITEAYDKTDMSMHERVLEKQKFLEDKRGKAVSYDEAFEEVVCDALSTMLTDGSFHEKLMEIKVKDKGLFNTIKRFFDKMIAKFKKVYEELTPDQRDAQDIRAMKDMFDKIQTAFAEALVEASDNFQAAQNSTEAIENSDKTAYSNRNKNRFFADNVFPSGLIHSAVTHWANRKDIQIGDSRLEEYKGSYYRVEKVDGTDFGYQITKKYKSQNFEEVLNEYERHDSKKSPEIEFDEGVARYRETAEYGQAGYHADSSGTGYRRENGSVHGVVSGENGRREDSSQTERDRQSSLRDQRQTGRRNEPSVKTLRLDELSARAKWLREQIKRDRFSKEKKTEYRRELRKIQKEMDELMPGYYPSRNDKSKHSDRDSRGNQLSKEQQEYFKDSTVRDENGSLKVVYHGTRNADFTVFKRNATYFTDNKEMAGSYSPNGDMYEGYVNITKPYEIDAKGEKWSKIPIDDATKDFLQEYGASVFKEGGKWRTSPADIVSAIEEAVDNGDMNYDGIIIKNIDDTGSYYKDKSSHLATDYIVFNSNQFKNVDNKTPTSNADIRYSQRGAEADQADIHSRVFDMNAEVGKLQRSIEEFEKSTEFKAAHDRLSEAIQNDNIVDGVKQYQEWRESSGYAELIDKRDALRVELEKLTEERDNLIANEGAEAEKSAIAKSGLSEADYFRKQAVKEFGYTPYFYDAGYLTPNGKMLNFSGEKGKHFGSRGQDHRAIGIIYENTQGSEAMIRFMNDGNIRIMAETPGLDISSSVEPTKEQYATIKKFARENGSKERYFAVDISDENGRVIGNYEYDGYVNADRVVNDIKYFFEHGEVREQSSVAQFHWSERNNAPTFYSQMGKVVEGMKQEKFGASSVISMLRGRGVKAEEIRWSGIHAFLDGKKSVTKAELLEFINSSMLHIEETILDGNQGERVKLPDNYRLEETANDRGNPILNLYIDEELVDTFEQIFDGSISSTGNSEIWAMNEADLVGQILNHYAGMSYDEAYGNGTKETKWDEYKLGGGTNYRELLFKMPGASYNNQAMEAHWGDRSHGVLAHARMQDFNTFIGKMLFIEEIQSDWHNEGHKKGYANNLTQQENKQVEELIEKQTKVFEELGATLRMARQEENGSPKHTELMDKAYKLRSEERAIEAERKKLEGNIDGVPDVPFRDNYHEFVLKRLLRMAAEEGYDSIGWTTAQTQSDRWSDQYAEGYRIEYDQDIPKFLKKYGKQWGTTVGKTQLDNGTEVWSMAITDSMQKSVLEEGQAMYSERGNGTSNRHLLANAFEGITNGSEEYKFIQKYKDHIKELNKLDAKLSGLNAEIRKIRFGATGPRDTARLTQLENEAKETAKEINRYDKMLLSLEASEPLRKVIERERKKEAQKTKDHVKEIQQNKKVRAEQTELRHKIRKTIRDLDKILNRGNKQRNVKEDMKGFVSKALDLADYLFTDHISNDELIRRGIDAELIRGEKEAQLVKETEEILTKLYDEADSLTDEEFTRLDAKRKVNEDKLRDLLTAQRNKRLSTPVYNLFNDLVTEYASLKNSSQDAVKAAYNDEVERLLRTFLGDADSDRVKTLQNMRVADMTTEELWKLYNAYTMVLTTVRDANKFHVQGMKQTIEQVVGQIAGDFGSRKIPDKKLAIAAQKLVNKLGWDYEKLYYALDRIGSDAFTELIMNIADSENIVMQDIIEAMAFRDEIVEKYGFNNWAVNKEIDREFMDNTGKKFKMTLGQMMSLYAYSRREGAWDHIEYGGFVFGEAALTNPKPADSYKLSKEQCEAITNLLTKEQKGYVEDMQKFLSETMGEKGNEVSMQLYGIKMFGEKNYFPIHVAGQFKAQANESQAKAAAGFSSMSNAGFTHAQNPNAKAPFVLEGFNEIWADHVNEMSRYHGTVPALEDLRRVMNRSFYSDSVAESQSIKQLMENSYGKEAVEYFDNLYREANSGAITDKLQKKSKKLLSLFRKNSVAYSLSVIIQQPSALVRAYAMIDKKYFGFKGFGTITSGVAKAVSSKWNPAYANAYNEMLKYAPGVTMAKEIGGFDTATGGSIRSTLLDTGKSIKQKWKTGTALEKGKAVLDVVDNNAIANLPNVADKIAWIEIWNACKRETVATHKDLAPNSEEFMQMVGDRFTEVIRATQVYDSIFAKSPMLKSKNLAVQYLVSFMNEPNTVANMVESAVRSATKGDWKGGLRTGAAVIYSIIFNNVLKSIVYAMRDDDEDETYIEKYIEAITGGLMDDFNALNYIPLVRDAVSIAQGYDVERADMAIVADAVGAFNNVLKNAFSETEDMTEEQLIELDKKQTEAGWQLVESLAAFLGIPVKNIRREINGVLDHAKIAHANAGMTTAQSAWDKVYDAVIESIPFLQTKNTKQDKLYAAIIEGDQAYLDRLKSTYKTEDAYHTAVRKALRENDPRIREAALAEINGDPSERVRIAKLIKADGFDQDDVVMAINAEINKLTKTESDSGTTKVKGLYKIEDFVREYANGDMASLDAIQEDILDTAQKNGKTLEDAKKDFASDVRSKAKDVYLDGSLDDATTEKLLVEYADMDEEEAASKVSYWAFCEKNPEYDYLSESNVNDYLEFAEPAKIPMDVFAQYVVGTKGLTDIKDKWGDVELSKRDQVLDVIDSLPLTWKQKDALYLAAGYSESKIWDVPW